MSDSKKSAACGRLFRAGECECDGEALLFLTSRRLCPWSSCLLILWLWYLAAVFVFRQTPGSVSSSVSVWSCIGELAERCNAVGVGAITQQVSEATQGYEIGLLRSGGSSRSGISMYYMILATTTLNSTPTERRVDVVESLRSYRRERNYETVVIHYSCLIL